MSEDYKEILTFTVSEGAEGLASLTEITGKLQQGGGVVDLLEVKLWLA